MCFNFHTQEGCGGGNVLGFPIIASGLPYIFVVAYNNVARSDHIPSTNEYKYEKNNLRYSPVNASSSKRLIFRFALIGVLILLVALSGIIS